MKRFFLTLLTIATSCSTWAEPIARTNDLDQVVAGILRCIHAEDAQLSYVASQKRLGYSNEELADAFAKSIEKYKDAPEKERDRSLAIYWYAKIAETNQLWVLRDIALSETNYCGRCAMDMYFDQTIGTDECLRFVNEVLDSKNLPPSSRHNLWPSIIQYFDRNRTPSDPFRKQLLALIQKRAKQKEYEWNCVDILKRIAEWSDSVPCENSKDPI